MARCTWISCNASEAHYLTGENDAAISAEMLASRLPATGGAVVRQGAAGCTLACHGASAIAISGFPVAAIDTNGAGDAHIGSFIASLARGLEPLAACDLANAAAALSTTVEGPATTPSLNVVQAFVSQHKNSRTIDIELVL